MLKDLEKFGGNVSFSNYNELETAFVENKLHPGDLKRNCWELT
jgi:tyrosyl-tRNA synthetase (EC 6.1.1.1)